MIKREQSNRENKDDANLLRDDESNGDTRCLCGLPVCGIEILLVVDILLVVVVVVEKGRFIFSLSLSLYPTKWHQAILSIVQFWKVHFVHRASSIPSQCQPKLTQIYFIKKKIKKMILLTVAPSACRLKNCNS